MYVGICVIALQGIFTSSMKAQQTKILTAEKHNEYGLVYSLPITSLSITVTAEKETLIAGPYANYAKKYLGVQNPILTSGEKWTIKNVEVSRYGVIDSENRYLMQLKPGSTTFIAVDADGMLQSINIEPANSAVEPSQPVISEPEQRFSGLEYLEFANEDYHASQSTAKKAEILAEQLMEAREYYRDLTRGTAETTPTDGKQLELMLTNLRREDRALTAAFTGCSYKETITRTYTYLPEDDSSEILFRFSDFKGFCGPKDYAGAPVGISVSITAKGQLPVDALGKEKEIPKDAIRYRIPGEARIAISFGGEILFSKEMPFGQFGCEFGLSPSLFTDKKQPSYAIFDPVTGALLELATLKASLQ